MFYFMENLTSCNSVRNSLGTIPESSFQCQWIRTAGQFVGIYPYFYAIFDWAFVWHRIGQVARYRCNISNGSQCFFQTGIVMITIRKRVSQIIYRRKAGFSIKMNTFIRVPFVHPINLPDLPATRLLELQKKAYKEYYIRFRYILEKLAGIRSFVEIKNIFNGALLFLRIERGN